MNTKELMRSHQFGCTSVYNSSSQKKSTKFSVWFCFQQLATMSDSGRILFLYSWQRNALYPAIVVVFGQ